VRYDSVEEPEDLGEYDETRVAAKSADLPKTHWGSDCESGFPRQADPPLRYTRTHGQYPGCGGCLDAGGH
jgi:hypothetical protein